MATILEIIECKWIANVLREAFLCGCGFLLVNNLLYYELCALHMDLFSGPVVHTSSWSSYAPDIRVTLTVGMRKMCGMIDDIIFECVAFVQVQRPQATYCD